MDRIEIAVACLPAIIRNYAGKGLRDPLVKRDIVLQALALADEVLGHTSQKPTE